MDAAASVLAECALAPADDAPRLVWADLVGGERGELVTIQCDLARGGLTPAEVASRRRRERELLDAHGVEWAGALSSIATRWRFCRGFIESAKLTKPSPVLGEHPLLSTFEVDNAAHAIDIAGLLRRVQGFACRGRFNPVGGVPLSRLFHDLRALAIDDEDAIKILLGHAPIEQLWLRDAAIDTGLLGRVVSLEAPSNDSLVALPLRALRTTRLVGAMFGRLSPTLEYLSAEIVDIESFDHLPALRSLDADGNISGIVRALVRSKLSLRRLRLRSAISPPDLHALVERFGDLELLKLPHGTDLSGIAIAGELRVADVVPIESLLHATTFEPERPCFVQAKPATLVRLDRPGPIWDLPALPADQRVVIGRGTTAAVHVQSDMVSRHHAGLYWRGSGHVLRDLGSENGTYVDDRMIDEVLLADGDEFRAGNVILQYFTGPGARERADEALAATSGLDPETRLPKHQAPPFEVRIVNFEKLTGEYGPLVVTYVMRALARQLEGSFRGEKVWFVRRGVLGVESREIAERVGGWRQVEVGGAIIHVELVVM